MLVDLNELREDAGFLARKLYPDKERKQSEIVHRLMDICNKVQNSNVLIIHSPGGWGSSPVAELIDWERSIIDGVEATLTGLKAKWVLTQYFRTKNSIWYQLLHLPTQIRYSLTGKLAAAEVMAEELQFLSKHFRDLEIILLGASMGAAFNNTVMKYLKSSYNIYSIELGIVFLHLSRRIINDKVLGIDDNGFMPDPVVHWNFSKAAKAYFTAPCRWIQYLFKGTPHKFSYCINVPGHEYRWEFPAVGGRIKEFLQCNLNHKNKNPESAPILRVETIFKTDEGGFQASTN